MLAVSVVLTARLVLISDIWGIELEQSGQNLLGLVVGHLPKNLIVRIVRGKPLLAARV